VSIRLFEQKMTPEYNRRYIEHLRKVLRVIIQINGDWSDHLHLFNKNQIKLF
jgi:hypothetical protein